MKRYHRVLTIAGSDSGGGAGIQADLKTISACGCFGTSAVTAITAQNTIGVNAIHPVPVSVLEAQIRAVLDDIGADAIKLGMLHSTEVIDCVARLLAEYAVEHVVLDPVMVSTSGDKLIEDDAIKALQIKIFPHASVITPNIPEIQIISGRAIADRAELGAVAKALGRSYNFSVLAKGGHLTGTILKDFLYDRHNDTTLSFSNPKIETANTHGTGCTLSSALASYLAAGCPVSDAAAKAIDYVARAIVAGSDYSIGSGHGPVHHFHAFW
jgi:hydroxymethylpyrimidine/phosphomethylpyrimidine kinase